MGGLYPNLKNPSPETPPYFINILEEIIRINRLTSLRKASADLVDFATHPTVRKLYQLFHKLKLWTGPPKGGSLWVS